MTTKILTQDRLKELLHYNADTGVFTWRATRRAAIAGAIAGSRNPQNYIMVGVDTKLYSAHRLAWLYTHGVWPILELDHINRIRDDNRIDNLRLANRYTNTRNTNTRKDSLSGVKGVRWHKMQARWESRIQHNHKPITIGYYGNLQDAVQARKIAEILLGW
jgi:hypothetical protein